MSKLRNAGLALAFTIGTTSLLSGCGESRLENHFVMLDITVPSGDGTDQNWTRYFDFETDEFVTVITTDGQEPEEGRQHMSHYAFHQQQAYAEIKKSEWGKDPYEPQPVIGSIVDFIDGANPYSIDVSSAGISDDNFKKYTGVSREVHALLTEQTNSVTPQTVTPPGR